MADEGITIDFPVDIKGLPPEHLNVIMHALEELPFKIASPVVQFIQPQVFQQAVARKLNNGPRSSEDGAQESGG